MDFNFGIVGTEEIVSEAGQSFLFENPDSVEAAPEKAEEPEKEKEEAPLKEEKTFFDKEANGSALFEDSSSEEEVEEEEDEEGEATQEPE